MEMKNFVFSTLADNVDQIHMIRMGEPNTLL